MSKSPNEMKGQPDRFSKVPVEITVSVGKSRPTIRDLLAMDQNAVLPLDQRVEDPVEVYIGDKLIARGELEELDGEMKGQLGVRLTEISDFSGNGG